MGLEKNLVFASTLAIATAACSGPILRKDAEATRQAILALTPIDTPFPTKTPFSTLAPTFTPTPRPEYPTDTPRPTPGTPEPTPTLAEWQKFLTPGSIATAIAEAAAATATAVAANKNISQDKSELNTEQPRATDTPTPNQPTVIEIVKEVTKIVYIDRTPSQTTQPPAPAANPAPRPEPAPVPYVAPEPPALTPEAFEEPPAPSDSVGGVDGCTLSEVSDGSSVNLYLYNDGSYDEMKVYRADNPDDISRKNITDFPTATNMNGLTKDIDGTQANITPGLYEIVLDNTYTGRFVGPTGIMVKVCEAQVEPTQAALSEPAPANTATTVPLELQYKEPLIDVEKSETKDKDGHHAASGSDWILYGYDDRCQLNKPSLDQWNRWVRVNLSYLKLKDARFKNFNSGDQSMLDTASNMTYGMHTETGMVDGVVPPIAEKFDNDILRAKCNQLYSKP